MPIEPQPARPPDNSADPCRELTRDEIQWIRDQRKQHEHEAWLRGQVRVIWPWVMSIVGAVVAAAVWIKEHVRF